MPADSETNTAIGDQLRRVIQNARWDYGQEFWWSPERRYPSGGRRLGHLLVSEAVRLIHTRHGTIVRFLFLRPQLFLPLGDIDES